MAPELKNEQKILEAEEEIKSRILVRPEDDDKPIPIIRSYGRSSITLGEYVTLNLRHVKEIENLKDVIVHYWQDKGLTRPLNIIMIAKPGSGKSYFIKHLAKTITSEQKGKGSEILVISVSYNMATRQTTEDLVQPLTTVRNIKVDDCHPLLFLDEFDSEESNFPLLLPLLWDGKIQIAHRELKLGKVVIAMAGSDPRIKKVMDEAKSMQWESVTEETIFDRILNFFKKSDPKKLPDLLSRINTSVIEIPPLDERQIDKVCLALSLLDKRFKKAIECVPWALLHFIAVSNFQYEARSIEHFINLIPWPEEETAIRCGDLKHLPLSTDDNLTKSSLIYHLSTDEKYKTAKEIVDFWNSLLTCGRLVQFRDLKIGLEEPEGVVEYDQPEKAEEEAKEVIPITERDEVVD